MDSRIDGDPDSEVQTFISLGLTICQSKVLLFLVRSEASSATLIAKGTGISRPDIYRILPSLFKLGLIRRIISTPVKFEAVQFKEIISILVENKTSEMNFLKKKLESILYKDKTIKKISRPKYDFLLIPKGKAILKNRMKSVKETNEKLDLIISFSKNRNSDKTIDEDVLNGLDRALNRGVKIRHITDLPFDIKSVPNEVKKVWTHPLFQVKVVSDPLNCSLGIHDQKEFYISLSPSKRLDKSDDFWSKNPTLLAMAQALFEETWNNALPP
jgi:sugar-specific transcriptional regulator TrmB